MQSSHKLLQYSRGRQKIKIKDQDWFLHFEVLFSVSSDAIKFTWKRDFMGALPQEKLFSEHVSCWTRVSKTSRCNCQQNRFTEALSSTTAFAIPATDDKMTCPDFFWALSRWCLSLCVSGAVWCCAGHPSELGLRSWEFQLDYPVTLWKGFLCFRIFSAYNTPSGTAPDFS